MSWQRTFLIFLKIELIILLLCNVFILESHSCEDVEEKGAHRVKRSVQEDDRQEDNIHEKRSKQSSLEVFLSSKALDGEIDSLETQPLSTDDSLRGDSLLRRHEPKDDFSEILPASAHPGDSGIMETFPPEAPRSSVSSDFDESQLSFYKEGPLNKFPVYMFSSEEPQIDYNDFLTTSFQTSRAEEDDEDIEDDSEEEILYESKNLETVEGCDEIRGLIVLKKSKVRSSSWQRLIRKIFPQDDAQDVQEKVKQETGAVLFLDLGEQDEKYFTAAITFGIHGHRMLDQSKAFSDFGLNLLRNYKTDITEVEASHMRDHNPTTLKATKSKPVSSLRELGIDELCHKLKSIRGHISGLLGSCTGKDFFQYNPSFKKQKGSKKTDHFFDTIIALKKICQNLLDLSKELMPDMVIETDQDKIRLCNQSLWEKERQFMVSQSSKKGKKNKETLVTLARQKLPQYSYFPETFQLEGDSYTFSNRAPSQDLFFTFLPFF